jgi:SAM-dependent methyltransferase
MVEPSALPACLLCGTAQRVHFLFELTRPVLRCECGLVFSPQAAATTPQAYAREYYHCQVYADYVGDRPAIRRNATRALAELEPVVSGRRLLDVGCAHGFFLEAARARGWSVRGLEISEYASAYARRELELAVDTSSILAPPADLGTFDVITLWDVIEHLDRPDLALANVRRHLDPRGRLVLSTGDYGSWLRRLAGRRWRLFSDPTHRHFFDERTLGRLLSTAGFELLSVRWRGKHVSLAMSLHQSPLPFAAAVTRWLERRHWRPHFYVNLWDVMTIVGKPAAEA